MIEAYVEPSGESPDLARAEAIAAAEAVGGAGVSGVPPGTPGPLVAVHVPDLRALGELAARLALARRCLVEVRPGEPMDRRLRAEGADGASASFRRLGRSPGTSDDSVRAAGRSYRDGGGRIDLERPDRRYWLLSGDAGAEDRLLREVATVDRADTAARRMPLLPFQRPVSLPPRLARAAANLARIRAGDRVVDPFVGTGALLAEAALLGARSYGIDRDSEMVRGALRNFAHLKVDAAALVEGDAGAVDFEPGPPEFDALLTDPPYGRSSSTGGEDAEAVAARILPRWADRLRRGGRAVIVTPQGSAPLPEPWVVRTAVPVRVHRSLTREFRVYERRG